MCFAPGGAVQAAIKAARPILDQSPGSAARATADVSGVGEKGVAFRRGVVDAYPIGRAGLLKQHPEAFRLCHNELPPPAPAAHAALLLARAD